MFVKYLTNNQNSPIKAQITNELKRDLEFKL